MKAARQNGARSLETMMFAEAIGSRTGRGFSREQLIDGFLGHRSVLDNF
jgi:hypothetical protein